MRARLPLSYGSTSMHSHTLAGWGGAVVAVLLHASVAWADGGEPSLPPDRAVALALTAHPDLRAAETALSTAEASRSASSLFLSNPSASAWATPDGARADLGVSQPISLTGEGWHARRSARWSTEAAGASLDRSRRELAAAVRQAYVDAVVATGVVEVAREGSELAARLSFAVRRKHEEGEASTLDLRLARLAEVQAATRLLEARRSEADALRRLSALVMTPVEADDLVPDPLIVAPDAKAATAGERSDVEAAEAALDAARADLRWARAATVPGVSLGVGVGVEDGSTFVGPSVGLTLPLFDRNLVGRAQAVGGVDIAEGQLASVRARAETEQATAAARLAEAEAAVERAGVDLDAARAALASIESGVLAG
ncbi:MAG: TolC family protein, partial [Myxococcales bacterium]|nr:TolC family protein [Myxococcales bacterium]